MIYGNVLDSNNENSSSNHAIIIGAMKAGTSSLYNYLIQHPSICPCLVKEPHYFCSKFKPSNQGARSIKAYENLWDSDCRKHSVLLEASTGYTKYPAETGVSQRMHEYGINPKFIYLVRNPFDRIVSHYNYRKVSPGFDLKKDIVDNHLIHLSSYYLQLSQFLKYFPDKQQYMIINSSDFFRDPECVLKKIALFLQIDSTFKFNYGIVENKTVKLTRLELYLFRNKLIGWSKIIPQSLRKKLRNLLRAINQQEEPRSLTDEERLKIYLALKEDMKLLNQEFGVDVSVWGFDV